jgi:DNA-binding NtrC family response regulator
MTLRAFAQAAETGITIPPSGLGSVPAGAGAVDTHRSPSRPDMIEPVQRIQELPADREEPIRNIPMVSQSPKMQEVYRRIERVLHTTATVLITGEHGTEKGLIARIIHGHGSRGQGPFMAMSCPAILETLLESELFGHLERAAGGTLFVDGITEMSPTVQAKLLRVLQDGWFDRGHGNPPDRCQNHRGGHPRPQTAHRRGEIPARLVLPSQRLPYLPAPLTGEAGSIIPLALHFLGRYRLVLQKEIVGLSEDVRARLLGYAWPGNVHELVSVIEQAVHRCQGTVVTVEDLPPTLRAPGS